VLVVLVDVRDRVRDDLPAGGRRASSSAIQTLAVAQTLSNACGGPIAFKHMLGRLPGVSAATRHPEQAGADHCEDEDVPILVVLGLEHAQVALVRGDLLVEDGLDVARERDAEVVGDDALAERGAPSVGAGRRRVGRPTGLRWTAGLGCAGPVCSGLQCTALKLR
jgi:hypothetical protein